MRYLLGAIALMAMFLVSGEADAARRPLFSGDGQRVTRGDGPIAKLIELERRKNAAIREMFRR